MYVDISIVSRRWPYLWLCKLFRFILYHDDDYCRYRVLISCYFWGRKSQHDCFDGNCRDCNSESVFQIGFLNQVSYIINLKTVIVSSKSIYARRRYKSIDKVPHIVILGSVSHIALFNFLEEYLHEDHGDFNRHCVLMQPCRPDPNIELALM